jgi:hypothetical protein
MVKLTTEYLHMRREQILNTALQMLIIVNQLKVPLPLYNLILLALAASTKSDASCFGTSTGSVTAGTVTGAVGTIKYSWKNASSIEVGTTASVAELAC